MIPEKDLKMAQKLRENVLALHKSFNNQFKTMVESWDLFYNPKPDFLVQNFEIKLNDFIKNRKMLLSNLYNDENANNDFILNEIKNCNDRIEFHKQNQFTKEDEKTIKKLIKQRIPLRIKNKQEFDIHNENLIVIFNAYLFFLTTKLKRATDQAEAVIPDEVRKTKRRKTLQEFINNIEDKEAFLNDLKTTFPTEIGKEIRVIIDRLIMEDILILGAREYKPFLEVLEKYFNRHIGEYTGIQNKMIITAETSDPINKKLNPLIKNYKTK